MTFTGSTQVICFTSRQTLIRWNHKRNIVLVSSGRLKVLREEALTKKEYWTTSKFSSQGKGSDWNQMFNKLMIKIMIKVFNPLTIPCWFQACTVSFSPEFYGLFPRMCVLYLWESRLLCKSDEIWNNFFMTLCSIVLYASWGLGGWMWTASLRFDICVLNVIQEDESEFNFKRANLSDCGFNN